MIPAVLALAPQAASAQGIFFDWGSEQKKDDSGKENVTLANSAGRGGDVIVSFGDRKVYFIESQGKAISYPIAIPREQSRWSGVTSVSQKRISPDWTPTPEMFRENPRLPPWVPGGHPMNPLGTHALYLGASSYRIHGTDAPWTIGTAASKGCVRMYNKDVQDLFPRVRVGAKVTVTWNRYTTTPSTENPEVAAAGTAAPNGGIAPESPDRKRVASNHTADSDSGSSGGYASVSTDATSDDYVPAVSRSKSGTYYRKVSKADSEAGESYSGESKADDSKTGESSEKPDAGKADDNKETAVESKKKPAKSEHSQSKSEDKMAKSEDKVAKSEDKPAKSETASSHETKHEAAKTSAASAEKNAEADDNARRALAAAERAEAAAARAAAAADRLSSAKSAGTAAKPAGDGTAATPPSVAQN